MLYLRRTREPRGRRHAKATGRFPLRLVGVRSGLRPTQTASGFPSAPLPASLSPLSLSASAFRLTARFALCCLWVPEMALRGFRLSFLLALGCRAPLLSSAARLLTAVLLRMTALW